MCSSRPQQQKKQWDCGSRTKMHVCVVFAIGCDFRGFGFARFYGGNQLNQVHTCAEQALGEIGSLE
jgi:hypothetical protein